MRASFTLFAVLLLAAGGSAQTDHRLADRHARITGHQAAEDHLATVGEIDLQLKEAIGTTWQDSIYRYTYVCGRAVWKSRGAEAGTAAAERVLALVRQLDRNVLHQLDAMDDLARLYHGMGRMKDCARVDSMSMVLVDSSKEVPLVRRGKVRQRLGADFAQMGDYATSLRYYREARSVYERSDTLLALLMADVCNGTGAAYWHLGEPRKAEEQYGLALAYLEKSNDPKRGLRMAGILINRGILWQSTGDFQRSKVNYQESIRSCGAIADTARDPLLREEALLARTRGYVNLATVYFALGDDGHSRELLEMALKDRRALLEPDDPKLLGVQDRLADVEMAAKNYAKAEAYVRAYLLACEQYYGVRSEDYIRTCAKLGEVYAGLGRTAAADSLFKRSIALSEALEGADQDTELASAYRRHAQFYMDQGRQVEAIKELEAALAILRRVYGEGHPKVVAYDLVLAEAAFGNSDPGTTLRIADGALQLLGDRVAALKGDNVPQAWPQPQLLPDALYWKVKAERALGLRNGDDWRTDMDLGVLAVQRNKAAYDDEGSQLGHVGQEKVVFDLAIDLAGEQYAEERSTTALDRFLALTEADRSILLKGRLNDFTSIRFAGVPDSVLVEENRLIDALDIDPDDPDAVADLTRKELELAAFLKRLGRDHPQYFALRHGEPGVTLEDLRSKLLTPHRDLLAYAFTDEHLYMLVVRMDTALLAQVPAPGIAEQVKAFNAAMRSRDAVSHARQANALYERVFAPVAPFLKNPEILIIPDGDLQLVNFETLLFEPVDGGRPSDHMLIHKYAIGYLLSATTAVQFARLKGPASGKVTAFAPGFSDELKRGYLANMPDSSLVDRHFLDLVRQPFAVRTAEALGPLLNAQVNTGSAASEARFREQARAHGILHLGTHAEMNASSPMYSRLVFSKDGSGVDPDVDGYLHAYEIYELDLRAQLAVLTACETGTGTADAEGMRSLGYSFAYAGCPSLVMSLWPIDEKVSSEIITRFYGYLADGLPKHVALRRAKLDHLASADEELAMPYYWAGLVLVGDVEPMTVSHNTWLTPLLIGASVVIVLLFLLWWWRRRRA